MVSVVSNLMVVTKHSCLLDPLLVYFLLHHVYVLQ